MGVALVSFSLSSGSLWQSGVELIHNRNYHWREIGNRKSYKNLNTWHTFTSVYNLCGTVWSSHGIDTIVTPWGLWHKVYEHHIHLSVNRRSPTITEKASHHFIFNRKRILKTQIRLPRVQPGIKSVCGQQLGSVNVLVGLYFLPLHTRLFLQKSWCHFF